MRLIAEVVEVCSPSTVITAKGSGRRKTSRLERPSAATTEEVRVSICLSTHRYRISHHTPVTRTVRVLFEKGQIMMRKSIDVAVKTTYRVDVGAADISCRMATGKRYSVHGQRKRPRPRWMPTTRRRWISTDCSPPRRWPRRGWC